MRRRGLVGVTVLVLGVGTCGGGKSKPPADSCGGIAASQAVPVWVADAYYCLYKFGAVPGARGLALAPNGDSFVATNGGRLQVLFDADGNGVSDANEQATFATLPGGNHGVTFTATHVYASSASTVFRWAYTTGDRQATGAVETVVRGIGTGGHVTRTLVVDGKQRLYVSIGSATNVDAPATPDTPSSDRAVIRRYDLTKLPAGGFDAARRRAVASGLRNEARPAVRQGRPGASRTAATSWSWAARTSTSTTRVKS